MNTLFDTRMKNLILAVVAIFGLFLLLQSISTIAGIKAKTNVMPSNVISVRGTGEAVAKPDIAQFSFTVRENNKDVLASQQAMSEKVNKAIDYVKGQGVDEKDIKTESYYTNPTYQYVNMYSEGGYVPGGKQVLTGYEVVQTVSVKVRDVSKAGDLLTGIANLQIGEVSSLSFTIDDMDALKAEAKTKAIEQAREEADKISQALGVKLRKVVGYYEEYPLSGPMAEGYGGDMMMQKAVSNVSPQLPQGEQKVSATVTVAYEVEN